MLTKRLWLMVILAGGLGCGCDDDENGSSICDEAQAKHDECGTGIDMLADCDPSTMSPELECGTQQCTLRTDCAEFKLFMEQQFMSTEQVSCFQKCKVILSDTFACVDGSGVLPVQSKCDTVAGCPDGSDEVGCP